MSQNRLGKEKSPYLLQHADNPVDWYPWGEEAFARAAKEDKPIFLSIGYSTCHWCHVMEHESFEDPQVAALLNETFVCIKVDREERPDIDNIYMMVCQLSTGSGGWPLTIVMTPDRKPFIAATYIPKNQRFGRPGMMELIPKIKDFWDNR
ncbi:MAG: thioredoxin domain-containing protein, partial [Candidatus Latescibacterota bacterium]